MRLMTPLPASSLALILSVVPLVTSAGAQTLASRPDNYYAAGNRVIISTPMPADVLVAGREVDIKQPIAGDVLAAGWRFELTATAEDDLRVAGSEIVVDAPVNGDVTIAGGSVRLGPEAHVSGRSWITGRSVQIDGVLERELNVAAAEVVISGEVRKPVRIVAEKLDIRPGARLLAPVTYRGANEATIAKDATVTGPFTFTRIEEREARRERELPAVSTFLFTMHLFLAGLLVIVFMPRVEQSMIATLRAHALKSFVAGVTLLFTVPLAALFLMLTVLGLPIGLVLAATYAVALFAGVLTTAFFLGDAEARWLRPQSEPTRGQRALILLAGVLTLAVLRLILGGVAVFVAILFGVGALSVWLYQAYVRTTQVPGTV
jgi:cytoskeletal protein CcmA (bactofilin family)